MERSLNRMENRCFSKYVIGGILLVLTLIFMLGTMLEKRGLAGDIAGSSGGGRSVYFDVYRCGMPARAQPGFADKKRATCCL